jgi:glycine/D-amino acid oxidase-like deaminating enzyme
MAVLGKDIDYLIVGGGFYGCCLALYLSSISNRVLLVEAADGLMTRASRVNQARIHTGFHYPRSALTAVKSMILHQRFIQDFPEAVIDDFQMLYAIARRRSKVSANRFHRMFRDIGAPIKPASASQTALFDDSMVEAVFACNETAFDHSILEKLLSERLISAGVEVRLSTRLVGLTDQKTGIVASLSDGSEVRSRYAFNITYSQLNTILDKAERPRAQIKHELTELALVTPPPELNGIGVTVMDGPFFSCMPYPSENLYSLTHVRYTPHESWIDEFGKQAPHTLSPDNLPQSRAAHMVRDGQRYLPCLKHTKYEKSLFEVKTILIKNEQDDGRPILYHQKPADSRIISILGGKIDNVYDLFDLVQRTGPEFANANLDNILAKQGSPHV